MKNAFANLFLNMTGEGEAALVVASTTAHLGSPFHAIVVFILELFACPIPYHRRKDLLVGQSYVLRRHLRIQHKHINETRQRSPSR
jgi:hypothetical protein